MKKLSDADCDKSGLVWAPDSKIAPVDRHRPQAAPVDIDSGKTDIVAQSDAGNIAAAQFSPDGKWHLLLASQTSSCAPMCG